MGDRTLRYHEVIEVDMHVVVGSPRLVAATKERGEGQVFDVEIPGITETKVVVLEDQLTILPALDDPIVVSRGIEPHPGLDGGPFAVVVEVRAVPWHAMAIGRGHVGVVDIGDWRPVF